MNRWQKGRKNMNALTKCIICSIAIGGCLTITACNNTPPPFEAGLRLVTEEGIEGLTNTTVPLPGVYVSGNTTSTPGPGSTGNVDNFRGITGSLGIYDLSAAATDVYWQELFNFQDAMPQCGEASQSQYVPPVGGVATEVCYVIEY